MRTLLVWISVFSAACGQKSEQHVDFSRYFTNARVDGVDVRTVSVGELPLATGQIVVADPFYFTEEFTQPFRRSVSPGTYPVTLAVADLQSWGKRVAFARIRFSERPVVRWEVADTTFGVDAGLASYADMTTARAFAEVLQKFGREHPNGNYYDDVLSRDLPAAANWCVHRPVPGSTLSMMVFSSGLGDGHYSSYWGFDETDQVAQLVTDFQLFDRE